MNQNKNSPIEKLHYILIALFGAVLLFEWLPLDVVIQDFFYQFSTHQWLVNKNASLPKLIFYSGIKKIYIVFVVLISLLWLYARIKNRLLMWRKGMLIVILSCILVPATLNALKALTNVPCPKDIGHYGGVYPYVRVLDHYLPGQRPRQRLRCYPAGHASGGFALMSLYFLFLSVRAKKIAWYGALLLGWTIGSYKMLIGDHFFSHTLVSMLLSWLIIVLIARVVNTRGQKTEDRRQNL